MDKLNKTFESQQVLTAQEMNQITTKIDEIIDNTEIDSELSDSSTKPVQNKVINGKFTELESKQNSLENKITQHKVDFTVSESNKTYDIPLSIKTGDKIKIYISDIKQDPLQMYTIRTINQIRFDNSRDIYF